MSDPNRPGGFQSQPVDLLKATRTPVTRRRHSILGSVTTLVAQSVTALFGLTFFYNSSQHQVRLPSSTREEFLTLYQVRRH